MSNKILLIEDDEDIRNSFADILEIEGFSVSTAINGEDGLNFLKACGPKDLPALIVLDLMMPVLNGQSFLEEITNHHPELHRIPIIITSAHANLSDLSALPMPTHRIKKPLDLEAFLEVVNQYCKVKD